MISTELESRTKEIYLANGLNIRQAIDADASFIESVMLRILGGPCPKLASWYRSHPDLFKEQFLGPSGQEPTKRIMYTVETLQSLIVGSGGLIQKDPVNEPNMGELTTIYLLPEYRGHGLGRAIVDDLIGKARQISFESLYLTTRIELDVAIKLYHKLGFADARVQKFPESSKSISLEMRLLS